MLNEIVSVISDGCERGGFDSHINDGKRRFDSCPNNITLSFIGVYP